MSPEAGKGETIAVGTRVSFPYGGSRRTGTVADVSVLPDGAGGTAVSYLIDVGKRKVFVQSEDITPAAAPTTAFDPVAEGVAYGRKRPRSPRRH
jgi:hypothetical protein